jgi:hypothetical protein
VPAIAYAPGARATIADVWCGSLTEAAWAALAKASAQAVETRIDTYFMELLLHCAAPTAGPAIAQSGRRQSLQRRPVGTHREPDESLTKG